MGTEAEAYRMASSFIWVCDNRSVLICNQPDLSTGLIKSSIALSLSGERGHHLIIDRGGFGAHLVIGGILNGMID